MIDPLLPYTLPPSVKAGMLELAAQSDLLLLGEMHGTQEVPRLILGLLGDLSALGYGGLGLELPKGQTRQIGEWAAGRAEPPSFFRRSGFRDGRESAQMLSLLQQTLNHPANWHLLCFDVDGLHEGETWADRDRLMAEQLWEQWRERCAGQRVLAVCGNLHSRLVAPAEPDTGPWPSFGCVVQQNNPELAVHSINIVFHRGASFSGEVRKFNLGAEHFVIEAQMRPGGFGHTKDLYLPRATPATFL